MPLPGRAPLQPHRPHPLLLTGAGDLAVPKRRAPPVRGGCQLSTLLGLHLAKLHGTRSLSQRCPLPLLGFNTGAHPQRSPLLLPWSSMVCQHPRLCIPPCSASAPTSAPHIPFFGVRCHRLSTVCRAWRPRPQALPSRERGEILNVWEKLKDRRATPARCSVLCTNG